MKSAQALQLTEIGQDDKPVAFVQVDLLNAAGLGKACRQAWQAITFAQDNQPPQAAELTAAFRQRGQLFSAAQVQLPQPAEAATVLWQHGQHFETLERLLLLKAVSAEAQVCVDFSGVCVTH